MNIIENQLIKLFLRNILKIQKNQNGSDKNNWLLHAVSFILKEHYS